MSRTYDWFPWDREYRTNEWFLGLTSGQKWAWIAVLSEADKRWQVKKTSLSILARNVWAGEEETKQMLKSAIENGKIQDLGDCWFVVNGPKYRRIPAEDTGAERQRRYREGHKKQPEGLSVTEDVALRNTVTPITGQDRTGQDTTRQEKRREKSTPTGIKLDIPDQIVKIMHEVADRAGVPAYRDKVSRETWRPDLLEWGKKIGFGVMLDEAEKFKQWFLSQVETNKIPHNAKHEPRRRFLSNWLGRVASQDWRPGDTESGEYPSATGPSPYELTMRRLKAEDALPADPAAVEAGKRLLENLSGVPRGARGQVRRIDGTVVEACDKGTANN